MRHRNPSKPNERLVRRIRALSMPLLPKPTGLKPILHRLPGVKAVLFDVYGTILVSASGDVGRGGHGRRNQALAESFRSVGFTVTSRSAVPRGIELLDRTITEAHKALHKKGCLHPEIDICRIWAVVLKALKSQGMVMGSVNPGMVQMLAVEYECRVNPVWPMPGLRQTVISLKQAGEVLGIVSNAQFYTPLILECFLGGEWASRWLDRDVCVWSYRLREAKPSPRLVAAALKRLQRMYGIEPAEVLCVGNDMRNDILPAAEAGCRTALFAGDRRSYRPRRAEIAKAGRKPDVVISNLAQLENILTPGKRR